MLNDAERYIPWPCCHQRLQHFEFPCVRVTGGARHGEAAWFVNSRAVIT